jgi:hypothetical protein
MSQCQLKKVAIRKAKGKLDIQYTVATQHTESKLWAERSQKGQNESPEGRMSKMAE